MPKTNSQESTGGLAGVAGRLLVGSLVTAGGWIAYSRFGIDHHLPLPPAIPAE